MERYYVIAPALIPLAYSFVMFVYFCLRAALGSKPEVTGDHRKSSRVLGPFIKQFTFWLIRPLERAAVASRISPNVLTFSSALLCATAGVAIATGQLAIALWGLLGAGLFDVMDGRLARALQRSSKAGAFLDSVSDRWGELFFFAGFAWYLRDTQWLAVVMLALGASMMVSYTRARGEGLGVKVDGGTMQRAERVIAISIGVLVALLVEASKETSVHSQEILGWTLLIVGVLAAFTGIGRWIDGYKQLLALDAQQADGASEPAKPALSAEPASHDIAPTSNKHAA